MAKAKTKAAVKPQARQQTAVGVIERGKGYTIQAFMRALGWGFDSLSKARDNGLRVIYEGRAGFVSGDDFCDWLQSPERKTERW